MTSPPPLHHFFTGFWNTKHNQHSRWITTYIRRNKMFRRFFVLRILFSIVVVALIALGGFAIYRAGLTQGYMTGLQAASSAGNPVVPNNFPVPWGYYGPFGGFPVLLPILAIFVLLIIVRLALFPLFIMGGAMRHMGWWHRSAAGGPEFEAWTREWKKHSGHMAPPWAWHDQTPPEQPAKPDVESSAASKETQ
jgi:hypothetical protein